jgi:hypothetical protein
VPRPRIACTALAHRFITTWCTCVGSPITAASPASSRRSITIPAGSDATSWSSASTTTDCTCTGTRSPMPLRLKARMRSTSDLARMPALIAASMLRRCAEPSAASFCAISP